VSDDSFRRSSEDEQIARLEKLAARALGRWTFSAPALHTIKYRENAVFGVSDMRGRRAVMRVHRPQYRTDLDIRCELEWMRALGDAGIETPQAIATSDGEVLVVAGDADVPEPRQCDVLAWIDGEAPGTLEGGVHASHEAICALYRSVGEVAAKMHVLARDWKRPDPFSRPSWNVETLVGDNPTLGRFWELESLGDEQRRVLLAARDKLRERLGSLGAADALVHGDLVPDNILIDGPVQRIIDFDDFGWSWVGFEMATSLFPLQISGGFEAGFASYVEGYRPIAPFADEELELLPDMLLARGLSYLGWPAGRPEIHSARALVPMIASMLADAASDYLSR
jgi:Ser/Thr protein kinase RdoA (MazF antagonist)